MLPRSIYAKLHMASTLPDSSIQPVFDNQVQNGAAQSYRCGYIGNVLKIVPGQGSRFFEKPKYQVMTNFSPFKMDAEYHPWMGLDRYETAKSMLGDAEDDFDVEDCFKNIFPNG